MSTTIKYGDVMNIKRFARTWGRWIGVAGAMLIPAGVMAAITLPKTFVNGTTIVADDVNANFNAINAALPKVTEWQNFTPSLRTRFDGQTDAQVSNAAPINLSATGKFRRVGQEIEVVLRITSSGASNNNAGMNWLEVSLPSSALIGTVSAAPNTNLVGTASFWRGDGFFTGTVFRDDTPGRWYRLDFGQPYTGAAIGRASTNQITAAGLTLEAIFKVQLAEWTIAGP